MAFPSTGVLDSASRSDQGPPPSASWGSTQLLFDSFGMLVSSRAFRSAGVGGCSAYWLTATAADCEAYATVVSLAGYGRVYARMISPGTRSASGYRLQSSWYGEDRWRLQRIDNETATDIATVTASDPAPGDRIGLECIGSTIRGYWYHAGAWELVVSATDATYRAGGVIGLGADWDNTTLRDFGGGTITTASRLRTLALLGVG